MKMVARKAEMNVDELIALLEAEILNNTEQKVNNMDRKEILKEIIRDLHRGEDIGLLKNRFKELIEDVTPAEISRMEQSLIDEGMPESEVKRLCDVHVEVFKESLEAQEKPESIPGHPLHTFAMENRESEKIMGRIDRAMETLEGSSGTALYQEDQLNLKELLDTLSKIEYHYLRKENQLFPLLESRGISGPPQVMWAIHDDIRTLLKDARQQGATGNIITSELVSQLLGKIRDMNYKEQNILYPMAMDTLTDNDWLKVRRGEEEIGYSWILPGTKWPGENKKDEMSTLKPIEENIIEGMALDTGIMSLDQINLVLTHLPVDISFVDENDELKYYSATKERIFPRSPGVIGRKVQKCHPPKSVNTVKKILTSFKDGSRDSAAFWITLNGKFIHIRYFAVRDKNGNYRGTLEVSQDLTQLKKLEGENRLLDWN